MAFVSSQTRKSCPFLKLVTAYLQANEPFPLIGYLPPFWANPWIRRTFRVVGNTCFVHAAENDRVIRTYDFHES